jgi:hypothetical protein
MRVPDPTLRRAIDQLTADERQAIEQAARTGQVSPYTRQVYHKLRRILKRMVRAEK